MSAGALGPQSQLERDNQLERAELCWGIDIKSKQRAIIIYLVSWRILSFKRQDSIPAGAKRTNCARARTELNVTGLGGLAWPGTGSGTGTGSGSSFGCQQAEGQAHDAICLARCLLSSSFSATVGQISSLMESSRRAGGGKPSNNNNNNDDDNDNNNNGDCRPLACSVAGGRYAGSRLLAL